MMRDFRDSSNFKQLEICRPNREKFIGVLNKYSELHATDMSQVKRAAIDAMAYNESCLMAGKSIDIAEAPSSLKSAYAEAYQTYKVRAQAENEFLTGIMTDNQALMKKGLSTSMSTLIIEKNKFSKLSTISRSDSGFYLPGWFVIFLLIMLAIGIRGYLKRDKVESVGVIRFSFGIFRGLFSGIKDQVSSLREAKKDKDKEDV